MNNILQAIDRENKICYLVRDFDIDLLKSESCDYSNSFIEQLLTSSFLPVMNKPTRITYHNATLINNTFITNIENIENSMNLVLFLLIFQIIYLPCTCPRLQEYGKYTNLSTNLSIQRCN